MAVLIAGGGIAGLASAIALRRAGHDVEVAERTAELREIGAALSLWPNAMAALGLLGLEDEVAASSFEAPTACIRARGGNVLVEFDARGMRQVLDGLPRVVMRADLQAILVNACHRLDIPIRLGTALRGLEVGPAGVRVRTDGGEAVHSAVVGADGITSATRSWVVGADNLRDCHRTAWRAVVPSANDLVRETWLTVGVGRQFIASPAPNEQVYWAADTPNRTPSETSSPDPTSVLEAHFRGWHDPIPELIRSTPASHLVISDIFDRRPPRFLARGPVLLVGDAAHPMTPDLGQGACQALEDAAVLQVCSAGQSQMADVFSAFERHRLRRIRRIVRESYVMGRLATSTNPLLAAGRDRLVRLVPSAVRNHTLALYAARMAIEGQLPVPGMATQA